MRESIEQMHERLRGVMAASRFEALSQPYAWQQVSKLSQLPATALAAVRDGATWYALTAVTPEATGAYRIMVFHFAEGSNASGFVAWLAGIIKKEVGTGVMDEAPWLAGPSISLADLHAAPMFAVFRLAPEGAHLLGRQNRLQGWWDRVSARPNFVHTHVPPRHASTIQGRL